MRKLSLTKNRRTPLEYLNCFALVSLLAVSLHTLTSTGAHASGKKYKDKDWNEAAYDNCGLPVSSGSNSSAQWVRANGDRKMRMTLRQGQVGKCPTDAKARNQAPYWERAELKQVGHLPVGSRHRIAFEAIFLEGFKGKWETFFQLHGWNGNCHAYPPLMMMFDNQRLTIWALRGVSGDGRSGKNRGSHRNVVQRGVSISSLTGKPSQFEIDFDTSSRPGRLSVSLNGQNVVKNASIDFAKCAKPHFKFGVYRPGGKGSKTSAVLIDDIRVEQLN